MGIQWGPGLRFVLSVPSHPPRHLFYVARPPRAWGLQKTQRGRTEGGYTLPPLPRMHWKGGGGTPPPALQGAQPMTPHCLPDAKCQPQRHL